MEKSILQKNKRCAVCHRTDELHEHHIFEGPNRRLSEQYGLKVWLCARHHNMSGEGVHFNTGLDLRLKRIAQRQFEKQYGHEKFMKLFGRNYL